MTPQEHYAISEQLISVTRASGVSTSPSIIASRANDIARAQVHATLALVGAVLATANTHLDPSWPEDLLPAWQRGPITKEKD